MTPTPLLFVAKTNTEVRAECDRLEEQLLHLERDGEHVAAYIKEYPTCPSSTSAHTK